MMRTVVQTERFLRGPGSNRDSSVEGFSSGRSMGSLPLLVCEQKKRKGNFVRTDEQIETLKEFSI